MSKEILKNTAQELIVKIIDETDISIPLTDGNFSYDGRTLTPNDLVINEIYFQGGLVDISRNLNQVLILEGDTIWDNLDFNFSEGSTYPINITSSDNYTLILKMKKTASTEIIIENSFNNAFGAAFS